MSRANTKMQRRINTEIERVKGESLKTFVLRRYDKEGQPAHSVIDEIEEIAVEAPSVFTLYGWIRAWKEEEAAARAKAAATA